MKFFVITYKHPNVEGWNKYLSVHVKYLENLIKEGTLTASGPSIATPQKSAMFILFVVSHEEALDLISKDCYMIQGIVSESTMTEWATASGIFRNWKNK